MVHVENIVQAASDGSFAYAEEWAKTHSVKEARFGEQRAEIRQAFELGFSRGYQHALALSAGSPARAAAGTPHSPTLQGGKARAKNSRRSNR